MSTVARAVLEIVTDVSGVEPGIAKVRAQSEGLAGSLKSVAGMAGLAFGGAAIVGGIKNLISGTFDYAEEISDLSSKMAVSTDATQRWKVAADQSGSSIDTVGKAVTNLSKELDGGGKGVKQALKDAGLEFDAIRNMKPEDAFNATVAAVAKIQDPMTQARVATELFGKAGIELLPAIRNGFIQAGEGAAIMSAQTIKDLDAAKDQFEQLGHTITVWAGNAISWLGKAGEAVGGFVYRTSVRVMEGSEALAQYDAAAGDLARTQERVNAQQEQAEKVTAKAAAAARDKAKADADLETKEKAAAAAAERLREAFQKQVDVLTGKGLAREIAELAKQVAAAEKQGGLSAYQYKELGKRLDDLKSKGAQLPNTLHAIWLKHETLNPSIKVSTSAYEALAVAMRGTQLIPLHFAPPPLPLPFKEMTAEDWKRLLNFGALGGLKDAPEFIGFGKEIKRGLKASLADVGDIIGGVLLSAQAGARIDALALGQSLGSAIGQGIGRSLAGAVGAQVGGIVGGLVGGVVSGLFGGGNAGRDLVRQFTVAMGGAQALHDKLSLLGDKGERLWEMLSNAKGRGAAATAIKEIELAFQRAAERTADMNARLVDMRGRLEELKGQSEPTLRDMESAAERLGISFDKLGPIFAQQKLTETATEVWNAIDTLRRGGTDLNAILADSKDELQAMALESMKAGLTIPANFRDMYQAMVDNGTLLDENGEKLTDLTGLKFGEPVKSQWEIVADSIADLTKSIADLVAQLSGKLGDAISDVALEFKKLPKEWEFDVKPNFGFGSGGSGGGPKFGGAMAEGGFARVNGPTWFMAGEAGPEEAMFSGANQRFDFSGAGRQPLLVKIDTYLDGKRVARNQKKYIAGQALAAMGRA